MFLGDCLIRHLTGFHSTVSGSGVHCWYPQGRGNQVEVATAMSLHEAHPELAEAQAGNAHGLQSSCSCERCSMSSGRALQQAIAQIEAQRNGLIVSMRRLASSSILLGLGRIGCGVVACALHGLGEGLGSMCQVVGVG
jgi:hypothetical protein